RIGRAVARRARAFGMKIHYHDPVRLSDDLEEGAIYHANLDEMLPVVRFVSLHCPMSPDSRHLIGKRALDLLPRGAVLVNTARGPLLDDEAVLAALDDGRLFAVGLDVYEGEPRLHDGYRKRRNCFLLPHLGSATVETRNAMGFRCLDNLDAIFRGDQAPDALT
ncbi:MAG: NAD(P)-dependent oxidoreductase, partial [Geminicoccaceae bacterium]|nr:NAD(P)-dependent oxidoreductase [Geminicoccaceae bacterium]